MVSQELVNPLPQIRKEILSNGSYNWELRHLREYPALARFIKFGKEEQNQIIKAYEQWLAKPVFLAFEKIKKGEASLTFFPAIKKGNREYEYYLKKNLKENLSFFEENYNLFTIKRSNGHRNKFETRSMFLTLTCNPAIFHSRLEAWILLQRQYNLFITNLRKNFGKCYIIKSVESFENGFPHIHLLIFFKEPQKCFYAVDRKEFLFDNEILRKLQGFWHSHIKIMCPNFKRQNKKQRKDKNFCFNVLRDYLFKDLIKAYKYKKERTRKELLALSMSWFFGLRSYSISGLPSYLINTSITQTQIKEIQEAEVKNSNLITLKFLGILILPQKIPPPPDEIPETDVEKFKFYSQYINKIKKSRVKSQNNIITYPNIQNNNFYKRGQTILA